MAGQLNNVEVINPYQNQEIIHHKKFISHLGIAFVDLKFIEKNFMKHPRTILRKICGQFNYGTLNAIFGPAKSGKTTLLKCLCGRNNEGIHHNTQIYVNPDIPTRVVYLEKEIGHNIMLSLTVEEALEYAFLFRNPISSWEDRQAIIKEITKSLELYDVRNIPLNECMIEEQVRSQVAMVLATLDKPNMIFMDEPLHDIDVVGIEKFVTLMKLIGRQYSITITFTVGQILDSDILAIFDKLYVLSRGGLCVYEGSVEHMSLFLREADVIITSKIQTPIERLMKIASKPDQVTLRVANRVLSTRDDIYLLAQKYGVLALNGVETPIASISILNMVYLFSRSALHKYRFNWKSIVFYYLTIVSSTIVLTIAFSDGIGEPDSCYNQSNKEIIGRLIITNRDKTIEHGMNQNVVTIHGQNLVDENLKFLFVITIGLTLLQIFNSVKGLREEVKIAINEHRNGWLNITSYFAVKNALDIVVPFANTVTCCFISYLMTGQNWVHWRFWSFVYSQFSGVACAQSLGFVIGVISVFNSKHTNLMVMISSIILVVFSGYLIPLAEIEPWLQGFSHISFLKQSYELTLISLYGLGRCHEINMTNSFVLEEFGIEIEDNYWHNSIIIATHFIVYRLVFWLILTHKVNKQQNIYRPDVIGELEFENSDDIKPSK